MADDLPSGHASVAPVVTIKLTHYRRKRLRGRCKDCWKKHHLRFIRPPHRRIEWLASMHLEPLAHNSTDLSEVAIGEL
jgi:hypothetical protein